LLGLGDRLEPLIALHPSHGHACRYRDYDRGLRRFARGRDQRSVECERAGFERSRRAALQDRLRLHQRRTHHRSVHRTVRLQPTRCSATTPAASPPVEPVVASTTIQPVQPATTPAGKPKAQRATASATTRQVQPTNSAVATQQVQPAPPPVTAQAVQPPPAPAEADTPAAYGITSNGPTTDLYTTLFGPRRRDGQ